MRTRRSVYLLAGLLCDARVWTGVAAALEEDHEVNILSFEDHNSIGAMAETVLRHAGPHSVVIGHSMGGRVVLEVYRRAPERLAALGLLNTGIHARREGERESRERLVDLARQSGMTALAEAWLPPMMGAPPARVAALWPALVAMVEQQSVQSFAGQIQALLDRPDAESVLPTVMIPTFVSSATADRWSPIAQHEAMCLQLAQPTFVAIADAGHMAPAEAPQAVAQALQDWLRNLPSA